MRRFGRFELDSARRQLRRDGSSVHLEPKAYELLSLLVAESPRVVTKVELHERLWPNGVVADATLVALVKDLRQALDDRDREQPVIRTVHRVGYAFEPPVERVDSQPATHWLLANDRRLPLTHGANIVGRAAEAQIWIDHSTVSRRHARIVVDGASARVEDLASKNGTTVGSSRLSEPRVLCDGDCIVFGDAQFTYRRLDVNPAAVTEGVTTGR
jgi:DNA-binding winged helix-turn-helix (wHTH) protein